ncbi:disease resistance protein RPV1 isoform X2 [Cryptomeria japonica]|uniref:disease resistance protein RPV1 isoform X2 n=1 Tax=Cryptomeria japonica TaxID=3369 RepID=UPI0027D9E7B7|nr:disease resistance protein RPV1 isoform X2 [Cryptomeria japonica]
MSSVASPAPTSPTTSELIDRFLKTSEDAPDFNLEQLVHMIDSVISQYDTKGKRNPSFGKLNYGAAGHPSAADTSKFSEDVSKHVNIISRQISKSLGDKHGTTIAVLNTFGNMHWVGVGFLVVAAVLQRLDTIESNRMERLKLLKSMNNLCKVIMQLKRLPHLKNEMQTRIKESIQLIVEGAILCCFQKKRKTLGRLYMASKDKQDLEELSFQVDEMRKTLNEQINVCILDDIHSTMGSSASQAPFLNDAVGIEQQITKVVGLLDLENDKPVVAVVIHGIGGAGKTTLADAVYVSLQDKFHGWKHSKATLIQNLDLDPKIEELQSQIVQDLTGVKQKVRDYKSGQQCLKEIMEKETVFLYIDNVLRRDHLEKLLPKEITGPKKIRMLLTARKTNILGVVEDCRIKPCKIYPMGPLSLDAALQVLCKKIDREQDINSILDERPQAKEIAKKCSCCPLFLEVVGAYLHKRKNKDEAYERVLNWLQCGEAFSGYKEESFDDSRILFAYEELQPSAQAAFLDICSFFYNWEWEEVACIVGEEELESLEEGALLKRIELEEGYDVKRKVNRISIHDLLLAAGRNKSKGNRFNDLGDFSAVLNNEQALRQIKGVWLGWNKKPFHLLAEKLDAMCGSLRVFAMGDSIIVKGKCSQQFNELRFLQVGKVPNLPFDISRLKRLTFMDYNSEGNMVLDLSKIQSKLKVLKLSEQGKSLQNLEINPYTVAVLKDLRICAWRFCKLQKLPKAFQQLNKLQQLDLSKCEFTEIPESFGQLFALEKLNLSFSQNLKELPDSLEKLQALQELVLSYCRNLKKLPEGFGKLKALTKLDLTYCENLQELPGSFDKLYSLRSLWLEHCSSLFGLHERIGNLTSLTSLRLGECAKLRSIPESIGQLTSLAGSISFSGCSSLTEVPEEICKLTMIKKISLGRCSSLKMLPSRLIEISSLQDLDLHGCENLQEMCNNFHCLVALIKLNMVNCWSLSKLPKGFGKLRCLQELCLSGCRKLEELCSDFHCLRALIKLDLSECSSLMILPEQFGDLACLEELDLSGCFQLESLSANFHSLPSLIRLGLINCERLEGKWMDSVVAIESLWRVDISGSERMIQRWMEMQREKDDCHLVVVTGKLQESDSSLLLKATISKFFREERILIDSHQHPFCSSSLQPETALILIISLRSTEPSVWELLERNLQRLESNYKSFKLIYIGKEFSSLPTNLKDRILAYTPENSQASLLLDKLFALFPTYREYVFCTSDGLQENGMKCFTVWEDISYILNEVSFLIRTPRESNTELLRALLLTTETDFLLIKNKQRVQVTDIQDKMLLLLITPINISETQTSALKDMYLKMQDRHDYLAEVVWIPRVDWGKPTWAEYQRCATNSAWPVVPNPWLVNPESLNHLVNTATALVVVDAKGMISCKDALPMVERWGLEAYPFCQSREDDLRKLEWEGLKVQSSVEFVFQNLESSQLKRVPNEKVQISRHLDAIKYQVLQLHVNDTMCSRQLQRLLKFKVSC